MTKEIPETFNSATWEEATRKERAAFEAVEKERDAQFNEMEQLAQSAGCRFLRNPAMRFIEFKTWQDALDFQAFAAEEKNISVKIVDPPEKDYSPIKQGFRVFPSSVV